ncbi:hypothetical protein Q3G72_026036 [Acer saccharum]|nr:hypothetical protein Q3G72_004306 [Acer saccharum]KAK1583672.1 hypothetical protein Q3G72_026036 [Acer saccharum]
MSIMIKSPAEGGSDDDDDEDVNHDDDRRTKQQRRTTTTMAGHEARRSFVVHEATQRTPVNHDGVVAVAKPRSSSARPLETRQRPPSLVQIDRQRLFSSKHFGADLKLMIWGLMVEDDDDKFGRFGFGSIRFQMLWWLDFGWVVVHSGDWFGGGDGWFTDLMGV